MWVMGRCLNVILGSIQDYSYDRRELCLTPSAVQSVVSELCVCELFVINPGQYQSDTE